MKLLAAVSVKPFRPGMEDEKSTFVAQLQCYKWQALTHCGEGAPQSQHLSLDVPSFFWRAASCMTISFVYTMTQYEFLSLLFEFRDRAPNLPVLPLSMLIVCCQVRNAGCGVDTLNWLQSKYLCLKPKIVPESSPFSSSTNRKTGFVLNLLLHNIVHYSIQTLLYV